MKRYRIANDVFLTEADGDYKQNRLSVCLFAPLERRSITETALSAFLIERGTRDYPDMTQLKRKLNELYGAELFADYSCSRMSRVIEGNMAGVDGGLVGSEGLGAEREKLLLDMLFHPALKDGGFDGESVEIEKEKLRDTIRSVINDKRDYCRKRLAESFFEGDERAISNDGYEEDLGAITGESLYKAYEEFIKSASVEIVYAGRPCAGLAERMAAAFGDRSAKPKKPLTAIPYREEKRIVEAFPVEQDKLAIAFTTGRLLDEREQTALRVGSALFGGTPTSRLFMNVREKQSLCYYAATRQSYRSGGGLIMDSGIAHGNAERTRAAVLKELETLAEHGPTDTELAQVKLFFKSIVDSVGDTSGSLAEFCRSSVERYGRLVTPKEDIEAVEAVTREEIMAVMSLLKPAASCLITKEEAAK